MTTFSFELRGAALTARSAGTLWWPEHRVLAVADLHLGKAERVARRQGVMLPPYEMAETLSRLRAEIEVCDPAHVIALGDSFDDLAAAEALPDPIRAELLTLTSGRRWSWITGNHDPGPVDVPGDSVAVLHLGPLVFRHIAEPRATGEVSGHYHPKARLAGRRRAAFLVDDRRVILPAFGAYTGGLDCQAPVLRALMGPKALAVVTGPQALPVPMASTKR